MPVTHTIEVTEYQFTELSDSAKENALSQYASDLGYDWWDSVYDDFLSICDLIGIDIGGTKSRPTIWFSGFWSQGDGACFEGSYSYKKGFVKAVKDYAPMDKELHRIVESIASIQKRNFYQLSAYISHRGYYYHSGTMSVTVERDWRYDGISESDCDDMEQAFRDLADWLYNSLEKQYEYLTSEESFRESCEVNGWMFDSEGNMV